MTRTFTLQMLSWASPSLARLAVPGVVNVCFVEGLVNVATTNSRCDPVLAKEDSLSQVHGTGVEPSKRTEPMHLLGWERAEKMIFCGRPSSERLQEYGMYFLPEGASSMPKNTPGQDRAGDLQRVRLTS